MRYVATVAGVEHQLEVEDRGNGSYQILLGDRRFDVDLRQIGNDSYSVIVGNRSYDFAVVRDGEEMVVASPEGSVRLTLVDALRYAMKSRLKPREVSGRAEVKAAMPGRVVTVMVAPGEEVEGGRAVMVIEAMKMENEIKAPKSGKVIEVKVTEGQTVEKGELLLVIE